MKKSLYSEGVRDGIPIGLGYLSVSFGFGISAVNGGLSPILAVLISLTNLTSAGQVAGLDIILKAGTVLEMILTQLVINARYFLMSLSLSQKLDGSFKTRHRFLAAFGITDEIFGVASAKKGLLRPSYMYGLILLPLLGWTGGTLLGALAGSVLPLAIRNALGIAIYGMFVAIIVPPAKRERGVLAAVLLGIAVSLVLAYVPIFSFVTSGFAVIISALLAATAAALLFPVKKKEEETEE